MKIMISYQVDTVEEARSVMDAVENRGKLTTFRVHDTPDEVGTAARAMYNPSEALAPRKNISPGMPTITKIGTPAKEEIMSCLGKKMIPPTKYTEHLKLLWLRGEVKFDGQVYYL